KRKACRNFLCAPGMRDRSKSRRPWWTSSNACLARPSSPAAIAGTVPAARLPLRAIPIPGRPRAIGLWVYGDATGHWLRANYIDGEGNRRVTDFTPVGGLTWTGWRWVEAPIDPEAPLPISFERVYVVEFDSRRQSAGVLYFD